MRATLLMPTKSPMRTAQTVNITSYHFCPLYDTYFLRDGYREVGANIGVKGMLIFSPEGVNVLLAGSQQQIDTFIAHFSQDSRFAELTYKVSYSDTNPFNHMFVKRKNHLVPSDIDVAVDKIPAPHLSATELKTWLDEKKDFILLDTRNEYEIEFGTFEKAEHLHIRKFRQLSEKLEQQENWKDKPVVMFCTGGIRCERGAPLAKKLGFKEVYQLDGGILRYFEHCGGAHYKGDCFVFDGREAVTPELKPAHLPTGE